MAKKHNTQERIAVEAAWQEILGSALWYAAVKLGNNDETLVEAEKSLHTKIIDWATLKLGTTK